MKLRKISPVSLFVVAVFFNSTAALLAAPPSTKPAEGLRENTPGAYALTGARVVIASGRVIERGTVVIRDGVIAEVRDDDTVPDDVRLLDVSGKTIYPGLIDAYSEMTVDTAALKQGATYWNDQIRPQLSVADQYKTDATLNATLRSQGITVRLAAPSGGIIKGTSALVTTGDEAADRAILRRDVALHMRLTTSRGRSRDQYPNSPMGAVALARQAMHDGLWYHDAWWAHRVRGVPERPERNDALEVLQSYPGSATPVIIDASNEIFFLRADQFANEYSLNAIMLGSGNEYRRLDAIRATGRAVIVPVNFPKPPNVATAESAMNVSLEQMMHWDIAPENAARLHRARVRIALTSHGLKDKKEFVPAVRKAVERGLPADAALQALTVTPSQLLGIDSRVGSIEKGKAANLIVTDGDLFDKKTKLLETWVDGRRYEIEKPPLFDLTGNWEVRHSNGELKPESFIVALTGKPVKLAGTVRHVEANADDKQQIKLDRIGLRDARFSCTFDAKLFQLEGVVQLSAVVEKADDDQLTWLGHIVLPNGRRVEITAVRTEKIAEAQANESDEGKKDEGDDKKDEETEEKVAGPALFDVNYPLGAFGRASPLRQPQHVLFKNATVWTCAKEGVLEQASVLISGGKIIAIGHEIEVPDGAVVIDCGGKHITPGIIDCHSHMATDGGVNESAQAITAEVRIGDFIDCDDIDIYRQLAGGVTCANILHGSANPIGGQNQVIKLRWGDLPEQMKFAEAPPGIKFALGENVKQSNWGDDYTSRYPQTRMGVEQIIRDEFEAARVYMKRLDEWQRTHKGLPPRRDLELDAIAEILRGERWIHCHSYRQDEILALIRTLDDYGITIGTFQHILEGYKVADAMAKHGAMGSAFSDWWAYKFEVYDAIPYNGALMHNAGVVVSFNSDDRELGRHLNHEAAKAVKYGGVDPVEALKFVTLNAALQLRIDKYVGSIEPGKHADLVVWSGPPLSNFSRCEQTWIDGRKYFDRDEDLKQRDEVNRMRAALVQKILASGETMRKPSEEDVDESDLWPREDTFCHPHHRHH